MPGDEDIIQLGQAPISEAEPAGEAARYEPEYEALEAEVGKLSSLEGGEVNWSVVRDGGCGLLRDKTKDLLVAVYVAYALLETSSFAGFHTGLQLIDGMCRTFWESMYPPLKRIRAREQVFGWLCERFNAWARSNAPFPADAADPLAACQEQAGLLVDFCDEKMSEVGGSGLVTLIRSLRDAGNRIQAGGGEGEAEAEGAGTEVDGAASTAVAPSAPVAAASAPLSALDTGNFQASRREAFRRLRDIADFFEKAEPHSPVAPMLRRVLRWGEMDYARLYQELLKNSRDGRAYLWDALGVEVEESGY
jgi:type VI secretion system protein VasJ